MEAYHREIVEEPISRREAMMAPGVEEAVNDAIALLKEKYPDSAGKTKEFFKAVKSAGKEKIQAHFKKPSIVDEVHSSGDTVGKILDLVCAATLDLSPYHLSKQPKKDRKLRVETLYNMLDHIYSGKRCPLGKANMFINCLNDVYPGIGIIGNTDTLALSSAREFYAETWKALGPKDLYQKVLLYVDPPKKMGLPPAERKKLRIHLVKMFSRLKMATHEESEAGKSINKLLDYPANIGVPDIGRTKTIYVISRLYQLQFLLHNYPSELQAKIREALEEVRTAKTLENVESSSLIEFMDLVHLYDDITEFGDRVDKIELPDKDTKLVNPLEKLKNSVSTKASEWEFKKGIDLEEHQENIKNKGDNLNGLKNIIKDIMVDADFICNFFAFWHMRLLETQEEELANELNKLYEQVMKIPLSARSITDTDIRLIASGVMQFAEGADDTEDAAVRKAHLYDFNRILIHALTHAPDTWSEAFWGILSQALAAIKKLEHSEEHLERNVKLTSYPAPLLDQLDYLAKVRGEILLNDLPRRLYMPCFFDIGSLLKEAEKQEDEKKFRNFVTRIPIQLKLKFALQCPRAISSITNILSLIGKFNNQSENKIFADHCWKNSPVLSTETDADFICNFFTACAMTNELNELYETLMKMPLRLRSIADEEISSIASHVVQFARNADDAVDSIARVDLNRVLIHALTHSPKTWSNEFWGIFSSALQELKLNIEPISYPRTLLFQLDYLARIYRNITPNRIPHTLYMPCFFDMEPLLKEAAEQEDEKKYNDFVRRIPEQLKLKFALQSPRPLSSIDNITNMIGAFNNNADKEIFIEHCWRNSPVLRTETDADCICNFFSCWDMITALRPRDDEALNNKLYRLYERLMSIPLSARSVTDQEIPLYQLNPYNFNRVLIHALTHAPSTWTLKFEEIFLTAIHIMREKNLSNKPLFDQLNYLANVRLNILPNNFPDRLYMPCFFSGIPPTKMARVTINRQHIGLVLQVLINDKRESSKTYLAEIFHALPEENQIALLSVEEIRKDIVRKADQEKDIYKSIIHAIPNAKKLQFILECPRSMSSVPDIMFSINCLYHEEKIRTFMEHCWKNSPVLSSEGDRYPFDFFQYIFSDSTMQLFLAKQCYETRRTDACFASVYHALSTENKEKFLEAYGVADVPEPKDEKTRDFIFISNFFELWSEARKKLPRDSSAVDDLYRRLLQVPVSMRTIDLDERSLELTRDLAVFSLAIDFPRNLPNRILITALTVSPAEWDKKATFLSILSMIISSIKQFQYTDSIANAYPQELVETLKFLRRDNDGQLSHFSRYFPFNLMGMSPKALAKIIIEAGTCFEKDHIRMISDAVTEEEFLSVVKKLPGRLQVRSLPFMSSMNTLKFSKELIEKILGDFKVDAVDNIQYILEALRDEKHLKHFIDEYWPRIIAALKERFPNFSYCFYELMECIPLHMRPKLIDDYAQTSNAPVARVFSLLPEELRYNFIVTYSGKMRGFAEICTALKQVSDTEEQRSLVRHFWPSIEILSRGANDGFANLQEFLLPEELASIFKVSSKEVWRSADSRPSSESSKVLPPPSMAWVERHTLFPPLPSKELAAADDEEECQEIEKQRDLEFAAMCSKFNVKPA